MAAKTMPAANTTNLRINEIPEMRWWRGRLIKKASPAIDERDVHKIWP
jgi:hypothetical protein